MTLLCQRGQRVAILVHDLVGHCHRLLEIRIVRQCLKSTAREFSDVQLLATFKIKALHEFTREDHAIRVADLLDLDFHDGISKGCPATLYNMYNIICRRSTSV